MTVESVDVGPELEAILDARWMDRAACRAANLTENFFLDRHESQPIALTYCGSCPVASECLVYALVRVEKFGIWGGLFERERRVLRVLLDHSGIRFRLTPCA
jgi:WhiB family redox-sensing transcriptional regulator